MPSVRRLVELRRSSAILEALWSSEHVEQVEVLWEEDLALEGRAGYYDATGALKDVMQNHMLQVLAILTMEIPRGAGATEVREARARALAALRPEDVRGGTRRARYVAGGGTPAYADEEGVDPERGTETFAEVVLRLDSRRWQGTRFVLRAGKALAQRRKEAVLTFRSPAGEQLRIGIDGPLDLSLRLPGAVFGAPPPDDDLPAYAHVLLDVLTGGTSLSVRGDEAEAAWDAMTPVLDAWAAGEVPLEEYPAGSGGLPPRR
jgi:glucose-6-phosphate 1-dehydrogenase